MNTVYSTGPVENAAGNAATSVWVKALNLSLNEEAMINIKVFKLNGQKTQIGEATLTILPDSSDFEVFNITDILQYEVQITAYNNQHTLVNVWAKDANADLVAAQRFVHNELNIINPNSQNNNNKIKAKKASKRQQIRYR